MKNNKLFLRIIILTFLIYACNSNAQENKLFEEFLYVTFKEVKPNEDFALYSVFLDSTKHYESISFGKYKYQQFIPIEMGYVAADTFIIPYLMFNKNNFHITLFEYITEDDSEFTNNGAYYYFVIYNKKGEIINSYKLLSGKDQQWFEDGVNYDSKLFLSKGKIKYLLYGPYKVPEMEANCLEEIYEIGDNGSFERVSERNYKARKVDEWNW